MRQIDEDEALNNSKLKVRKIKGTTLIIDIFHNNFNGFVGEFKKNFKIMENNNTESVTINKEENKIKYLIKTSERPYFSRSPFYLREHYE